MIPERIRPVLDSTRSLAERFAADGHRLYLVGGVVRDVLANRELGDIDVDLTTDARPDAIKALVGPVAEAVWTQGERFGTIGCRVEGRDLEITTHRAEAYAPDSRKPDVTFSTEVEADLSAPGLHRQRHGPGDHGGRATSRSWSIRSTAPSTW